MPTAPPSKPALGVVQEALLDVKGAIADAIAGLEQEHMHFNAMLELHNRMHQEEKWILDGLDARLPELRQLGQLVQQLESSISAADAAAIKQRGEQLLEQVGHVLRELETIQDRLNALQQQFASAAKKYLGEWKEAKGLDAALHSLKRLADRLAVALEHERYVKRIKRSTKCRHERPS